MMKRIKKLGAAICALLCTVSALPRAAVSAADAVAISVLALGDETLLAEEGETAAAELVADYYHGTATNDAAADMTSSDLVRLLKNDSDIQADVADADVILVSVGYQDLMNVVFYENPYYTNAAACTTFLGLMQASSSSVALQMIEYVIDALPDVVETINANLEKTISLIREQNDSAEIVIQCVQNPIAVNTTTLLEQGLSESRVTATQELRNFLDVCMQGGSYTSSYYTLKTLTISTGINQSIADISDAHTADFYSEFYGTSDASALGFYLTNLENLRMTYTPVGQVVLAAAVVTASDVLTCGDGSVLTAAYADTGEQTTLLQMQASLDSLIQTAGTAVYQERILGDIDADGTVSIQDASMALLEYANQAAGNGSSFHVLERRAADIKHDHTVTIQDAALILRYYADLAAGVDTSWDTLLTS